MMVINKTNKNYKRSQKGRSMVEMLGVLAIVGVLSVGGVYGYGVAMKKHKANELLHQASMLASSIAAQIASGKTDLALENFGNSSNGSFSSVKGPDGSTDYQSGDDKFTMQITGMDEAVCKQMQGMKGGTVRSVSCSAVDANGKVTATLTYNKDLSTGPVPSDYSTEKSCKELGRYWCFAKGDKGECSVSDCCEGVTCPDGMACSGGACFCESDSQYLKNGICTDCPGSGGTVSETDPTVCCKNNAGYSETWEDYYAENQACGCPENWGGQGIGTLSSAGICCRNGHSWNEGMAYYDVQNFEKCGCPENGELKDDVCCRNGFAWESSSYSIYDPTCGCPGEIKNGVCCGDNGLAWGGGQQSPAIFNAACGCPEGGRQEYEDGQLICCLGTRKYDYNGWPAGYNTTAVACGGCPNNGEKIGNVCCSNGYKWNGSDYYDPSYYDPKTCGCPAGGEEKNGVCCQGEYEYDPRMILYGTVNYAACGCPSGGTLKEGVCCNSNNLAWNGSSYSQYNAACGCPNGGTLKDGVCCNSNNLAWSGSSYSQYNAACGCPNGGTLNEGVCCNNNNLAWGSGYAGDGYYYRNEACGCPKGGTEMNGICCLNGYAWDDDFLMYGPPDERCS